MSEPALTETETADLRCIAAMIVPASTKYGVPGADDPLIFADILKSLGGETNAVRAGLARAAGLAGVPIAGLGAPARDALAAKLRAEGGAPIAAITRVVLLCYYRDDRVMLSLGLEPRPPFPKGHVLEQGDSSLLDPVRVRKPFWRSAT
jgi:hypothetical protein